MSKEFIEHFIAKKRFITDIWYDEAHKKYHSIVSNLYHADGFNTIEEIREFLTLKGKESKQS